MQNTYVLRTALQFIPLSELPFRATRRSGVSSGDQIRHGLGSYRNGSVLECRLLKRQQTTGRQNRQGRTAGLLPGPARTQISGIHF